MYDIGDVWHGTIEVKDLDGDLADSTVVLNLTLPDQTVAGPFTPTHDSIGKYHYDYTTVQAGRHVARWAGTSVAFGHTGVFDVETLDISLVSLADVKTQLTKSTTADDDPLRRFILSASENIETSCGVCAVRSFTDQATSFGSGLTLPHVPLISVQTLTPVSVGTPGLDAADLKLNKAAGVLTQASGTAFMGTYDVTYTAGRPIIPSSLRDACLFIVQYLWESRRGGATLVPGQGGDETVILPGWGYAIPGRAAQLIANFPNAPGFA